VIAFAILGFPRTTRQSRAVSLFAVIVSVAGLRIGGFAGSAIAYNTPFAIVFVYLMIASAIGGGGLLVWRGVALDLDEKINLRRSAQNALVRLEWLAAKLNIRMPSRELLRRLASSE